jgi:hypothetical protein
VTRVKSEAAADLAGHIESDVGESYVPTTSLRAGYCPTHISDKGADMGDKGGKKDKEKNKQQQQTKQKQQEQKKQDKARPRTP